MNQEKHQYLIVLNILMKMKIQIVQYFLIQNVFYLYKGCNFTLWDLGGEKARILWRHYFQSANAIILVIDSTDNDNIEDAIEEFRKLLTEEDLKGCPFLIMANRQDLENAESPDEIKKKFGEIIGRKFEVIGTSAITGQGIKEGYEWVFNTIIKNNKKNS